LATGVPPTKSESQAKASTRTRAAVVAYRPISEARPMPSDSFAPTRSLIRKVAATYALVIAALTGPFAARYAYAQQTSLVFRLDGGNTTYTFGVNERGELQSLYWGGRLGSHDTIAPARSLHEMASFDSPYTTTPQEFASWGAGLFTEPALK